MDDFYSHVVRTTDLALSLEDEREREATFQSLSGYLKVRDNVLELEPNLWPTITLVGVVIIVAFRSDAFFFTLMIRAPSFRRNKCKHCFYLKERTFGLV